MRRALLRIAGLPCMTMSVRFLVLRAAGVRTLTRNISSGCLFGGNEITIAKGTFVNTGCFFDTFAPIDIGSKCHLGMQVMIATSTHEPGTDECRAGTLHGRPVTVGNGCWLGARAIVQPGVTIGDGCVIAAGAVVVRDCAPNGLYAGVPATRVRDL